VAVLSTIVGNIVIAAHASNPEFTGPEVASAIAVIAGCFVVAIGLLRWGWIVDLISLTAISAFMTGSAINIAVGQVPGLMGITVPNSRDSTYIVVIQSLKNIRTAGYDAAMGLTALTLLYLIRSLCKAGAKKWPSKQKAFFFASTLRTVFVILLYTLISWLVNRNRTKSPFKILGTVPRGKFPLLVPLLMVYLMRPQVSRLQEYQRSPPLSSACFLLRYLL
jgi:sodium-independent sulfate anion transporter 11